MFTPSCERCIADAMGPFAKLSPDHLIRLKEVRVPHTYEPGQHLYFQGTPALAVYCISLGRVKLTHLTSGGGEHVTGVRTPGRLLGYRAVLANRLHRVSAEPLERTIACVIPREAFLELLREDHAFTHAMLVRVACESIACEEAMMDRTLQRVRTRLARFLLQEVPAELRAARTPVLVPLGMRHEEIALLIDTTRETLSRTLHSLAERGVLEQHGRDIRILDMPALRRLARFEPSEDSGTSTRA